MEKHIHKMTCIATSALMFMATTPVCALAEAEEERGGIDLLVPALAELIPACIAFLIVYMVLAKMVWPSIVKMMNDREQALNDQFEAADKAKKELEETSKQCNQQLADAHAAASEILIKAKQDAEEERARIIYEAHVQAADIIEKGHKAVEAERAHVLEDLSRSVADLSVEIAGKIIGAELTDEKHLKLASRYLEEMEAQDA